MSFLNSTAYVSIHEDMSRLGLGLVVLGVVSHISEVMKGSQLFILLFAYQQNASGPSGKPTVHVAKSLLIVGSPQYVLCAIKPQVQVNYEIYFRENDFW